MAVNATEQTIVRQLLTDEIFYIPKLIEFNEVWWKRKTIFRKVIIHDPYSVVITFSSFQIYMFTGIMDILIQS